MLNTIQIIENNILKIAIKPKIYASDINVSNMDLVIVLKLIAVELEIELLLAKFISLSLLKI